MYYQQKLVSRPLEDSELVERARRGDEDAYEELVRAYQGIAFRTAYVIAGSASDAEEAAQEAFVKATGFIWRDGEIAESERFQIDLPEMSWDLAQRHAVYSTFDYTNA